MADTKACTEKVAEIRTTLLGCEEALNEILGQEVEEATKKEERMEAKLVGLEHSLDGVVAYILYKSALEKWWRGCK